MTVWNAPAVKLSHEQTVEVVTYFDNIAKKVERKAVKRLGWLSIGNEQKCIAYADDMVEAKYGFRIRDMFATPAS